MPAASRAACLSLILGARISRGRPGITTRERPGSTADGPDERTAQMSSSAESSGSEQDLIPGAGSHTDQYVTGTQETGTFITDEEPTADTPAHGSSNAGMNAIAANRTDSPDD